MLTLLIGAGVLFVLSLIPLVLLYVRTYGKYRGIRVVTCPETKDTATIKLDFLHAASSKALGEMELRVRSCSHWPKRLSCGQGCAEEFAEAPAANQLPAFLAQSPEIEPRRS